MPTNRYLIGSVLIWMATAIAAFAQILPSPDQGVSDLATLSGEAELADLTEVLAFVLDMALALALAAGIAWHPKRMRERRTIEDVSKPVLFLLYGLIGMAVGFLVVRHGYIIGFVVFGMGALLRFRNSMDKTEDTVQVMLVTLAGLTVGLGLPISAVLLTLVSWVLIWLSGRTRAYELGVKAADAESLLAATEAVADVLNKNRIVCVNRTSNPAKGSAQLLIKGPTAMDEAHLESEFIQAMPEGVSIRLKH